MRRFFGILWKTVKYGALTLLALVFAGVFAIVFFEHDVPKALLSRITDSISSDDMLVTAESASFRFSRGLKVRNLRAFAKKRHPMKADEPVTPVVSAALVDVELNLRRIPWERDSIVKGITVVDLKYPRLPEGYYVPDSVEFPGQPDFKEVDEPLKFELPGMRPFRLTLVRPDILSVAPKSVEVKSVSLSHGRMDADKIDLQWADSDAMMLLAGEVRLDLESQLVHGEVHGHARQHNIRPMLVALDIPKALPYIDAFTKVEPPVDAACKFDVNLRNNDLHIFLDLHPLGGFYNGVPLKRADGTVDLRVFVRDTYQNARIEVGSAKKPLDVAIADGTSMKGTIVYENTNDVGYVDFDVESHTSLSNALAVADVMNDGTLDCISPETVPDMTLKGRLAVDPRYAALNDLRGTVAFERGSVLSIPLRDASGEFHLKGCDVTFTNVNAKSTRGGSLSGNGRISIPEFKQDNARFNVDITCRDVPLTDVAETFKVDLGDRHGRVDAHVSFAGPIASNAVARLSGEGHVISRDGHLAQMKIFAGLTEYLARHVPGIAGLVNQSHGSLDFAITNGVFTSSNIRVEGEIFSIQARGSYDIPKDSLDFTARVTLTKNESFLGKLATPITWPFANLSRMLLDFKIQGPIDNPSWTYNKNIMDRLK